MSEKVMNKIKNGREYRQMVIEPVEGVTDQIVEGYATTFNQPYTLYSFDDDRGTHAVREQVAPDAFKEADMSDVIMQYDHAGRVFARLSNGTLSLEEDEHGLKVRANLGGTEIGRQLFEEIQGGYTSKMSFGFTVAEDDIVPDGTDYLRTIKRIGKLYDVSAVSLPANDFTEISARSHCDGAIAEMEAERLRAEKEAEEQRQRLEEIQNRLKALKGETHGD
jgi:HK97 family phage prohead protease